MTLATYAFSGCLGSRNYASRRYVVLACLSDARAEALRLLSEWPSCDAIRVEEAEAGIDERVYRPE